MGQYCEVDFENFFPLVEHLLRQARGYIHLAYIWESAPREEKKIYFLDKIEIVKQIASRH